MVTWPMTSRDLQRCCEAVRSATLAKAWLLVIRLTPCVYRDMLCAVVKCLSVRLSVCLSATDIFLFRLLVCGVTFVTDVKGQMWIYIANSRKKALIRWSISPPSALVLNPNFWLCSLPLSPVLCPRSDLSSGTTKALLHYHSHSRSGILSTRLSRPIVGIRSFHHLLAPAHHSSFLGTKHGYGISTGSIVTL